MARRKGKVSATLRVKNLSSDATEQDLRSLFSHYGNVTRVYIALDRETKQSRGVAFVSFFDRAGAELAMEKLQGYGFDHLNLKIEIAEPTQKAKAAAKQTSRQRRQKAKKQRRAKARTKAGLKRIENAWLRVYFFRFKMVLVCR